VAIARFLQLYKAAKAVVVGLWRVVYVHAVIDLNHVVTVGVGFDDFAETHRGWGDSGFWVLDFGSESRSVGRAIVLHHDAPKGGKW
jgi:hypothetical protein